LKKERAEEVEGPKSIPLKVMLAYLCGASVWGLVLLFLVDWTGLDPRLAMQLGVAEVTIFIVATALLLYFVLRHYVSALERYTKLVSQSRERLSKVFHHSPLPMAVTRLSDGTILEANRSFCRLLGTEREELLGRSTLELKIWRTPEQRASLVEVLKRGGHVRDLNLTFSRRDGTPAHVLLSLEKVELGGEDRVLTAIMDVTERRAVEDALRKSEERYRRLVEASPDAIFVVKEGVVTLANAAALSLLGAGHEEEVLGRTGQSLVHPDDLPLFTSKVAEALKSGLSARAEVRLLRLDGGVAEVEVSATSLALEGGESILVVASDISERKRVERALRESEMRYRTLWEASPISLWEEDFSQVKVRLDELKASGVKDVRTYLLEHLDEVKQLASMVRVLKVNPSTLRLYGASSLEELLAHIVEVLPDPSGEHFAERLAAIAEGRGVYEAEVPNLTVDGRTILVNLKWEVVPGYEGTYSRTLAAVVDVTERAKLVDELKRSEERFRSIFQHSAVGVSIASPDGRIMDANPALCEMLGFSREELLSMKFMDYTYHEDVGPNLSLHEELLHRQIDHFHIEKRYVRKDGGIIWARVTVSAVYGPNGAPLFTIGMAEDITARKRAEEELKRYRDSLEAVVELRTKQLREAERRATVGQVAAMVGHDLRNPLQVIMNTIYLAREKAKQLPLQRGSRGAKELMGTIREAMDELERQARYMDKIVSDLQAYSRPVVPIPRQTNIPALVREVLSSIRLGEEIEVKTNFDPILETVVADPDMLKKVLFNLTINAVQAMPSGGTLTISTLKCDDLMVLEVKDTGVGISKENMKKLFTPFFTTKAKGQGMGLTVCKRLVEAHDGTISVESEEGKGSIFTVIIPVRPPPGGYSSESLVGGGVVGHNVRGAAGSTDPAGLPASSVLM